MPQKTSPSAIVPLLLEVDFKDEYVAELLESFYKSFWQFITMMLKSTWILFISWKPILSQAVESVQDIGWFDEATSLEELVNNLERDTGEWTCLNQLDLTPVVEKELERLSQKMQKNYLETSKKAEIVSKELELPRIL